MRTKRRGAMRRTVFHLVLWPVLAGLAVNAHAAPRRHAAAERDAPPAHGKAGGRAAFERQERAARREDPCAGLSRTDRRRCERDQARAAEAEAQRLSRGERRRTASFPPPASSKAAKPVHELQPEDLIGGLETPSRTDAATGLRGSAGVSIPTASAKAGAVAARGRGASRPGSFREVILEDGQSLDDLAARTGVSVADLARLNGLSSPEDVPTGMRLKLPSTGRAPAARLAEAPPAPVESAAPPPAPTPRPSRRAFASAGPSTGPRPYSSLGPEGASIGEPAPVRRGGRTQADALAAYAVASARAPHLADREDARHERFVWPLRAEVVSAFGPHGEGRRNDGVDFQARPGDAVRASAAGEVVYAGKEIAGSGGNLVLLKHADGWVTAYSHLGRLVVAMRQTVDQGQEIGESPDGGGAPVHFEVRQPGAGGAKPVDPQSVLPARGGGETGRGS